MQQIKYISPNPKKYIPLWTKKDMNLNASKQKKPVELIKISFDSNKQPVLVAHKISSKDKFHLSASKNFEPMKKLQRFKLTGTRCNFCNVEFNNPEIFKMHMARHTKGRPWTCSRCHVDQKDVCSFFKHIHDGCNIQKH